MYTIQDKYQKAILFAADKHKYQKIPGTNLPYMLHISNVAMEILIAGEKTTDFDTKLAVQIAILHDTLEDTETTFTELKKNFGKEVANGVFALTKVGEKSKAEKMKESIDKILKNDKEVGAVKLADRITNLQQAPKHWNKDKKVIYREEAKLILEKLGYANKYLKNRLAMKIEEYLKYI